MTHVSGPWDAVPLVVGEIGGEVRRVRAIAFHAELGVSVGSELDLTGTAAGEFIDGGFFVEIPAGVGNSEYEAPHDRVAGHGHVAEPEEAAKLARDHEAARKAMGRRQAREADVERRTGRRAGA